MTPFYLGIDVSKGYADFQLLDEHRQPMLASFQLDDTHEGHQQLEHILTNFFKDHPQACLYAAVESTGGYENNWFARLLRFQEKLPIQVARLNPEGVKAYARGCLQRTGTDAISAIRIAEYLMVHPDKVNYHPTHELRGLRKQLGLIRMLTKQHTQLLNQMESLLYGACPELLTFCRQGMPKWLLSLIRQYPTAPKLAKARAKTIAKIPYITIERANQLIQLAKNSIATETDEATEFVITATANQIAQLNATIKQLAQQLEKQCQLPEVKLLTSFPGISTLTAISLILEIGSIHRFKSAKKLAAFFGLHPVYHQSGDKKGQVRMSKKGRKEPRRILFMTAMNASINNPTIKAVFDKHTQKGMKSIAAIGVCMHKITRIIFGMLKHNTPFDPEIDRCYQERSHPKDAKPKNNPARRFQTFDEKAPISNRQNKKRREQTQSSQVVNFDHVSGINEPAPNPQSNMNNLFCQRTNFNPNDSKYYLNEILKFLA